MRELSAHATRSRRESDEVREIRWVFMWKLKKLGLKERKQAKVCAFFFFLTVSSVLDFIQTQGRSRMHAVHYYNIWVDTVYEETNFSSRAL